MSALYPRLGAIALEAALAAGRVLRRGFGGPLVVRVKKGAGLVTDFDLAAERAALGVLTHRKRGRPDFGILSEESAPDASRSEGRTGRWVLDPLDGTTNYVHRFPMFCVSIAAEWEGRIVAGVIHHPILGETYTAIRGGGAWLNGRPISVSATRALGRSLLTTGFTYRKERWLREEIAMFGRMSRLVRAIRRPGSAALDLAYVARGVFDGFWERNLSPWDVAAGSLLVEEAGGKVTDFRGNPFSLRGPEILASNPGLHAGLARALRARN